MFRALTDDRRPHWLPGSMTGVDQGRTTVRARSNDRLAAPIANFPAKAPLSRHVKPAASVEKYRDTMLRHRF
jgi:hypothetical protein